MLTNIYARIALLAVLIAGVMLAYRWAYNNGVTSERNVWVTTQNKALVETQTKLADLEYEYALLVTANSDSYQKGLKDGQLKKTNVIARVNDGTLKLRDKFAASCPEPVATSNAPSGGRDATPGSELSRQTSEFLIELASEADDVVKQLTTCQIDYKALFETCSQRQVF